LYSRGGVADCSGHGRGIVGVRRRTEVSCVDAFLVQQTEQVHQRATRALEPVGRVDQGSSCGRHLAWFLERLHEDLVERRLGVFEGGVLVHQRETRGKAERERVGAHDSRRKTVQGVDERPR
jgi:hypothetical protein